MFRRDRTQLSGQDRSTNRIDFICMYFGSQAIFAARFQNLSALLCIKYACFAEHITELSDFLFRNCWDHFFAQKTDICVPVSFILRRQCMGPHKGGHYVHSMPLL